MRSAAPLLLSLPFVAIAIQQGLSRSEPPTPEAPAPTAPFVVPEALCDGFDWPVGPPDASGYYDAQPFGRNRHLGEDWNGLGGGDTDLGDPVHAIGDGVVRMAEDVGGGWGNVVTVVHRTPDGALVESLYGHLDAIEVTVGEALRRGQRLGTIGDAGGQYLAHLHLELRDLPGLDPGPGYSAAPKHRLAPSAFIRANRPRR